MISPLFYEEAVTGLSASISDPLLQFELQFNDGVSIVLRQHRPFLLVEELTALAVQLVKRLKMFARDL